MVRNPESKPRSSFGDRLRDFGAKALAIFGIVSTAIAGAGCNNSEVNGPITPDTVATDTQEIPPSPEPHNTEPPSPEREIKDINELVENLEKAKDMNETRATIFKFVNDNIDEKYRLPVDEYGRVPTEDKNSAETAQRFGDWSSEAIRLIAEVIKYGKLDEETQRTISEKFLDGFTAGFGKSSLEAQLNLIIGDPDADIGRFTPTKTLLRGTAANPDEAPKVCRDVNKGSYDITNPLDGNGIGLGGCPPADYKVNVSKSGSVNVLVYELTIVYNTSHKNPGKTNVDADKLGETDDSHDIGKQRSAIPVIVVSHFLTEGGGETHPQDGKSVITATDPSVLEYISENDTYGFNK